MISAGIGLFIGILGAIVIVLPLLYAFPRAVFDAFRGRVVWWAPLQYLAAPFLWVLSFFAAGLLLGSFGFDAWVNHYVLTYGFVWAQWTGMGLVLVHCLTPKGRRQLDADYCRTAGLPRLSRLRHSSDQTRGVLSNSQAASYRPKKLPASSGIERETPGEYQQGPESAHLTRDRNDVEERAQVRALLADILSGKKPPA